MKLTHQDNKEMAELAILIKKIDNLSVGYVNELSDEIFQQQPFLLSVLLGYQFDVTPEEFEEIMKIYFLIWEFFKTNKKLPVRQVNSTDYEKIQRRHFKMLKYAEGEHDKKEIMSIYTHDLEKIKSKSLLTAVLFRYDTRPALINMEEKLKAIIFVGIKSFIECFEK